MWQKVTDRQTHKGVTVYSHLDMKTCMCITILKYITLMPAKGAFNILQFIIWIISKKEKDSFQKKRDGFKDNNSSFTK